MFNINRRGFLGSAAGGLAAAASRRSTLFAQDSAGSNSASPTEIAGTSLPDTLFLTWQRDPTTTMTLQWVAPETSAEVWVQYASLEGAIWQRAKSITKPYTNTDLKVYRCELTGLAPGNEYKFQIGAGSPVCRFRTMPDKATDTIRFVSGGDSGVDQHAVATNILAAKQEPSFALIAGDLAYDDGRSPATFTKFLQNYHAHMVDPQGRMIPMLTCIGNHEVDGAYRVTRAKSPQYLSLFDGMYPVNTYGVLDIGDYLSLVLLDTDHIAPIGEEQTDWLAKTLAARQDRPHLIVANHVPAYPSYRPPYGENGKLGTGEEQRRLWCPLFERFKVDVVLEHHDHTFKRTHPLTDGMHDKNGVIYLGDGSWGKLRIPKQPEERPYLAKVSAAYHMTTHTLEGDERFHVALDATGRIADVCATKSKRPSRKA